MSIQKKDFNLNKSIRFGQYSALSVSQIYCGTGDLPMPYCEEYLKDGLKLFKPLGEDFEKFFNLTISNGLLKVEVNPKAYYYKGVHLKHFDFGREISNALCEFEFGMPFDLYNGHEIIEDYNAVDNDERVGKERLIKFVHDDNEYNILRHGQPSYISWLIRNVEFFSLSPDDLNALEILDVLEFNGLSLWYVEQGVFSIRQSFLKSKNKFSDAIKQLNERKWAKFCEAENAGYDGNETGRYDGWGSNLRFDNNDDEDQIMRGLSNGDGDLFGF